MKRRAREQRLCRAFGRYVRALRKQQKLTQEGLALVAGLSADTIRRVETGVWPRFDTLNRLSRGLGMSASSLLEGFETGRRDEARELVALVRTASPKTIRMLIQLARLMIAELDGDDVGQLDELEHDDDDDDL
jgi:transcriptional regulator with XRE-family HTH domain